MKEKELKKAAEVVEKKPTKPVVEEVVTEKEIETAEQKLRELKEKDGVVMLLNVKHDGVFYKKGEKIQLTGEIKELFRKKGFIE